mgnify:FL=1
MQEAEEVDIEIEIDRNEDLPFIKVTGNRDSVAEFREKVTSELRRIKEEDAKENQKKYLAMKIEWMYKEKNARDWEPFDVNDALVSDNIACMTYGISKCCNCRV